MKLRPALVTIAMAFAFLPFEASADFEKADNIIGMVIVDGRNQRVGKVNELAVDFEAGRVAAVLVDTGGYLTSHQRIVAVPAALFKLGETPGDLRLSGDIDAFENAPVFDKSHWTEATARPAISDLYKRFKVTSYGGIGNLIPASKLQGMTVKNGNQRLGSVDSVVVELPSGKIPDLILDTDGQLTAVPPGAFLFRADNGTLQIDTSAPALKNAPHFKANQWREAVNGSITLNSAAPTDDQATTLEIERRILSAAGLSMDARRVEITTEKGQVTLRGMADSEREKAQLGSIAAAVVGADHVSNKVEVRVFALEDR